MISEDKPHAVRGGEEIDLIKLNAYLASQNTPISQVNFIAQFSDGYSNLTYFLKTATNEYVLRRPPFGAKEIKGGHDIGREFKVILALKNAGFNEIPNPILLCEDETIIGCVFYIMERVQGVILRAKDAPKILSTTTPATLKNLSEAFCDKLVKLHKIDIYKTNLIQIGKPEGYIQRQVLGWYKRYENAQTEPITAMNELAEWLIKHQPSDGKASLIHNDYKYDNVVLNTNNWAKIIAILDWEMATVGDPLMDLGTCLSYWAEAGDDDFQKGFNLTWLSGNLTRQEFANRYAEQSGREVVNILYYYVFGLFKNAVVIQQIYGRYKKGLSNDERFSNLIYGVKSLSKKAIQAIEKNKI